MVGVAGNHWNGLNKGKNKRTNRVGLYPEVMTREKVKVVEEVKREFTVREQKLRESGLKTQAKLNTLRNLVNDTDSNDENMEPVWSVGRQTDSDPNLTTLEVRILVANIQHIATSFFLGEEKK